MGSSPHSDLEFNLSHSGSFALVAVARGLRVGIDLERTRQGLSSQSIAQHYFSKSEVAEWKASPPEQAEPALLRATRPDPEEAARWSLFSLDVDPNNAAALAAESKSLQLRLWDWSAG